MHTADISTANHSPHIVILDDNELVRRMLKRLLHMHFPTAEITQCQHANEVFALVEQTAIDMIIVDHTLPEITGSSLVQELRFRGESVPIILISGSAHLDVDIEQFDATQFLLKDTVIHKLVPLAEKMLGK